MTVEFSIKPQKIEIKYINNIANIKLRKNIKEIIKEKNDKTITMFECDEVIFDVEVTSNLIQQIEDNFDLYFNYGQQQMELKKSKEKAEKKIYNLIQKYKLVDLSNNSQSASMLLTLLMTEIETLKNKVKTLEGKVDV